MASIFKSGASIKKVGTKILNVTPALIIINTSAAFPPTTITTNGPTYFKLIFSEPTNVFWRRGNGSFITLPTTDVGDGTHILQFWEANSSGQATPVNVVSKYNYGTAANRILSFEFERNLLIGLELNNFILPNQNFNIPFSEYPNLEILRLELLNHSITGLNLKGIKNSKIKELLIRGSISTTSDLYNVIPTQISEMPLKKFSIGGNYSNYVTSNAGLIGSITTLTELYFSSPFSQSEGLPDSFRNLVNLENFGIVSVDEALNITSLPNEITSFTKLKKLSFSNNSNASSFTNIGFSLSLFSDLQELNLALNVNSMTDFTFIGQLQNKIKFLDLRGQSNVNKLNTMITNLYNLISTNANKIGDNTLPYRGIVIKLDNYGNIAAIPTGTYQQPSGYVQGFDNGSPASFKEMLWVLANQYGCTVTFRST